MRVGVVGFGLAGRVFHAPLVASTPGLRLAAVVTGNPDRAREAAAAYPGVRVADRPEALWDGPDRVDVVVVATPNATHVPLARAALAAGCHAVVDKPVAPTAAEARDLAERARAAGRLVVPFHNRRWDGDFLTVRRLAAEGALGAVHRFASHFDRWRPGPPRAAWKEDAAPGAAGGLLYDLGPHLVDQAVALLGPVVEVYAELDRRRGEAAPGGELVDDDWFLALTHAGGARSHLGATTSAAEPAPRFRVLGSAGAYVKRGLDPQETQLGAGLRPGQAGYGEEPAALWGALTAGTATGTEPPRPVPTERGAYDRFYAGVRDALLGVAPPPVAVEDAVAGLAVIEAARRSATERRAVPVPG